jgi:hypothetical protein
LPTAAEGFAAAKARVVEAVGNWKARRLAVADSMLGTDIVAAAAIGGDLKEKVRLASQLNARDRKKSEAEPEDRTNASLQRYRHVRAAQWQAFFASEAKHL